MGGKGTERGVVESKISLKYTLLLMIVTSIICSVCVLIPAPNNGCFQNHVQLPEKTTLEMLKTNN